MTAQVYACGGTGVNIAKQISNLDIDICFIDSSDANLRDVKLDQVYLIEEQEGAGKDRSITYRNFKDIVGDVLIKFKPSKDINIIVSSLSGGSGSVQGPLIARQLIEAGFPVVVIGVDSRSSVIELRNSVNTLKTYKATSNQLQKSIALFYVSEHNRREADKQALSMINMLSLLVDRNNTAEFDITDLRNFLLFENVTDNSPDVSILVASPNEPISPEKGTSVVSTILVTTDRESSIQPVIPEYLATCIVTDPAYNLEDIRIDSILGKLGLIIDDFEETIKVQQDNKKVNRVKELVVESNTEDGFVVL